MKFCEDLIRRLDRIAKKNKDEFRYVFKVRPLRGHGIVVDFEAAETTEGHVFVSGRGETESIPVEHNLSVACEEAIQDALNSIEESCKEWGYENVE